MRIPIIEKEWQGATRDFVAVRIIGHNFDMYTHAMVDTGSHVTLVSELDLLTKTRLPIMSYERKPENIIHIGGSKMYKIDLGECRIVLRDTDEKEVEYRHIICGGIHSKDKERSGNIIPTILGNDFLEAQCLNIVGKKGMKYLQEFNE